MPDWHLSPTRTEPSVPSPCVRNCCLNEHDICLGCFRSLDEITRWSQSDQRQRRTIVNRARQRAKR